MRTSNAAKWLCRLSSMLTASLVITYLACVLRIDSLHETQIMCLAENIYHEGRGESKEAQKTLGLLTLARVYDSSKQWGKLPCDVIAQRKQFSWVMDWKLATNRDERQKWEEAKVLARDLYWGAWTYYKLPRGFECARFYKRTDDRGVSANGKKDFGTRIAVGTFDAHTAYRSAKPCTNPLPTV